MIDLPSPLEVVKFWRSAKSERYKRLSDYLDSIADEANQMADLWNEAAAQFEQQLLTPQDHVHMLQRIGVVRVMNPQYDRLVLHYRALSGVLGGKVSIEFRDDVTNTLGGIIQARIKLKELLLSACRIIQYEESISPELINDVAQAMSALNREAAALDVLTKTFKATKG